MARASRRPKSYGFTRSGVEITEEYLEKAAAEAEAGWDIEAILRARARATRGPRQSANLRVRLDADTRRALDERAARDETTASAVVRDALREYLRAG